MDAELVAVESFQCEVGRCIFRFNTKDYSQQHCPHVSLVVQRTSTCPMYKTGISSLG